MKTIKITLGKIKLSHVCEKAFILSKIFVAEFGVSLWGFVNIQFSCVSTSHFRLSDVCTLFGMTRSIISTDMPSFHVYFPFHHLIQLIEDI